LAKGTRRSNGDIELAPSVPLTSSRPPWKRLRPPRPPAAAAAGVISPGIKFLPASAFCAAGGRSLHRAADIFYTRPPHGFRPGTDGRRRRVAADRRPARPPVAAVTGRNFPMACIPANDTRLLRTSPTAARDDDIAAGVSDAARLQRQKVLTRRRRAGSVRLQLTVSKLSQPSVDSRRFSSYL